jgi:peptide/nickel transport system ATP-binding protein
MALVEIDNLHVRFASRTRVVQAIEGVSLTLEQGEVLGLLGESGSGKSVTLRSIMRLLPERGVTVTGAVRACGVDVLNADEDALRELRGPKVAMIFQEPMTALDPVFPIGHQIAEPIVFHEGVSWSAALARARQLLEIVQVPSPERRLQAYPHELSGGLRQRAMIAVALSCNPSVLLADEPTTALDATVQIQILLLLRSLQQELGMAAIMVTHDVGVAAEISDRIAVMYRGRIVETGSAVEVLKNPQHPYTRALLAATIRGDVIEEQHVTVQASDLG